MFYLDSNLSITVFISPPTAFIPVICIDHLSQHWQDLPEDRILALGDQFLLQEFGKTHDPLKTLSQPIDEKVVFGPLINNLYIILNSLKNRPSCEVLLYLCGHGIDPGNRCLIPDDLRPHPARESLETIEPGNWYPKEDELTYLGTFYGKCVKLFGASEKPLGFMGGEVYAHQRGYVGVLGVLGLWCYYLSDPEVKKSHHLTIVVDACYSGIWTSTLEAIHKGQSDDMKEYRDLLDEHPMTIQSATNEFEVSHGGLFTPLWIILNSLKYNDWKKDPPTESGEVEETQHPCLYTTKPDKNSPWKFFEDEEEFEHLHATVVREFQHFKETASSSQSSPIKKIPSSSQSSSSVDTKNSFVHYPVLRLREVHKYLKEKKENCEKNIETLKRKESSLKKENQKEKDNIKIILESFEAITSGDGLFEDRSRPAGGFLLSLGKLTEETENKYKSAVDVNKAKDKPISPGVYVFPGGEGDMSLIVTPGQDKVILIDGTKTADCFIAAWESVLKYLKRITHIIVTHHDLDHTFGIQLLLWRYCIDDWKGPPDISQAILYMNMHKDLTRGRNFWHEQEIKMLADKSIEVRKLIKADIEVRKLIIPQEPEKLIESEFSLEALLPTKALVDEMEACIPDKVKIKEVSSRGGTTAAKETKKVSSRGGTTAAKETKKVSSRGDTTAAKETKKVSSRGGTTAANVLSINLVAVWKEDAYLFTGDAHLSDVTEAAREFLKQNKKIKRFKYVDVPHHGSSHSNCKKVSKEYLGLQAIPAEEYLISHSGNHQNPSFQTIRDILTLNEFKGKLHFLYPKRKEIKKQKPENPKKSSVACCVCGTMPTTTQEWVCECVKDKSERIDTTLHEEYKCKFFKFE